MSEITYCEKHPTQEATLRCIRCNRYMCLNCIKGTSVGYMCTDCFSNHNKKFYSVENTDYPIVFAICALGCLVASMITMVIGSWWIALFIGGGAGGAVGTFARRITGRRVGENSAFIATAGAIVGGIISPFLYFFLQTGLLITDLSLVFRLFGLSVIVCIVGFAMAVFGVYQRRI